MTAALLPYPHRRNDCDICREYDADLTVTHPGLCNRPLLRCRRCAGPLLAEFLRNGYEITIRAVPKTYTSQPSARR